MAMSSLIFYLKKVFTDAINCFTCCFSLKTLDLRENFQTSFYEVLFHAKMADNLIAFNGFIILTK